MMTLPSGEVKMLMARGKVYGEVWYTIDVEYPYSYYEEKYTGNTQTVYQLKFLNHTISVPRIYKQAKSKEKILVQNYLLPISLVRQEQREVQIVEVIYTEDEAYTKAISLAKEKLIKENDKIQEIVSLKVLRQETNESKVKLKVFLSVIEEIGAVKKIEPVSPETSNENG